MFSTLAVITTIAFFVFFVLFIYVTACFIDIFIRKHKSAEECGEMLHKGSKFNLFVIIAAHAVKKKVNDRRVAGHVFKKVLKVLSKVTFSIDVFLAIASAILLSISMVFQQLAYGETIASLVVNLISGDDDCTCYLECTGDSDLDEQNTYLDIFGPYEYQKLLNSMVLTQAEEEFIDDVSYSYDTLWEVKKKEVGTSATLNKITTSEYQSNLATAKSELDDEWDNTIQAKRDKLQKNGTAVISSMGGYTKVAGSDTMSVVGSSMNASADAYLIELLTSSSYNQGSTRDDIASTYSNSITAIGSFRDDGLDRKSMNTEQLMTDLLSLLKDTKVNGRNQNCPVCGSARAEKLHRKCNGVSAWTMDPYYVVCYDQTITVDDNAVTDTETEVSDYVGSASAKDSQYGLCIDSTNDIWVYWYHQATEQCQWNAKDDTYGYYGSIRLGLSATCGTAADRGCSTYSTAMALSNLMGMEITPWVLARDVLKATPDYDSNLGLYYLTLSGRGIDDTGKVMDMNKGTLAASINEVYGSYGVQAKAITITQATVDEILEKGGMVVASFKNNGLSWYTGKSSHFIVIRSKDSNGLYYPLDSNVSDSKAVARMTDGQQWSTVYNALNYYPALAIWVEGGSANTGNTNTGSTGTGGVQTVTVPSGSNYTMDQVNADIAAGKYTKEDLDYMAALINESSSYEGCLAVASVVANRAKAGNTSIKSVVTASGQFAGYSSADVGRYSNTNLFNASVAILRGDASSVVGNCRYFFGRINGWDVWAENGAGLVYNIGGNVFYSTYGTVHNKSSASHTIDQTIYSASQSKWLLNSGQSKVY